MTMNIFLRKYARNRTVDEQKREKETYGNVHELIGDLATIRLFEMGHDGLEGGFLLGLGTALGLVNVKDSAQVV